MVASAVGAAVTGIAGGAASSLLGGGSSSGTEIPPQLLTAGGFATKRRSAGRIVGGTGKYRQSLVDRLADTFRTQASEFGNLRGLLQPGFGALTEARVSTLEDRGAQRVSNLRENLRRRRVAGSSFGQAQVQSELRQIDRDIAEVRARSFLEELDLNVQLIEKQYTSDLAAVDASLQNLNLEANFALQVATGVQSALTNNAIIQTQLAVQNARGLGAFIEPFASSIGSGAEDLISALLKRNQEPTNGKP